MKTHNEKTVTLKLKRGEICDLLISTLGAEQRSGAEKWSILHDKLVAILNDFDEKNPAE